MSTQYILFITLLAVFLTTGCQSQLRKTTQNALPPAAGSTPETTAKRDLPVRIDNQVEWTMLQSVAASSLKTGDIEHVENILDNMLQNTGDDPARWHSIAQVVAGLPRERATTWLNKMANIASGRKSPAIYLTLSQLATALGNTAAGMQFAEQSVALDKNNPKSRFWRARLLEMDKNTLQAQAEYQWLVKNHPDNSQYQEALANILRQQGELAAAEAIYAGLPENRDTLFKRLLLAIQRDEESLAQELFTRLVSYPIDSQASPEQTDKQWYLQGEAASLLGRDKEALLAYEKVQGGEHYVVARFRMARILERQGDITRTLEILRRLQNHDTETAAQAATYRATLLDREQRTEMAFAVLNEALRYRPNNITLLYARGLLHERHDNLDAMERDLQAILAIDPDNATALNALGYSLADHNTKLEEAKRYLEKALQLEPDNPAIIDSMGWLHYRLGNYSEAEKLIRKALALSGSDPEIYHHLIAVLKAQGKANEASAIARQARTEFPEFPDFQR